MLRSDRRARLLSAVMLTFVVALGSGQVLRPARAFSITSSSFSGTTFINEHFRMEIGPSYATLYDPYTGNVLAQRVYWSVQAMTQPSPVSWLNGTILLPTWVTMNWTFGPVVQQQQMGTYHRVVVSGILSNRLAVAVVFVGNSTGLPTSGPKISVVLQPISGWGVFRVQWRVEGIVASAFNLENRTGVNRQLIYGPMSPDLYASHSPSGENSLVALASDGSTILWGVNWQDALRYYQGMSAAPAIPRPNLAIQFGQFPLATGQEVTIDPIIEGGGGGGYPAVGISVPKVSISGFGTAATLTWSDNPSSAQDTFQWGTSPSYGNTINTFSHTVSLSNLQPTTLYYYQIMACATSYSCGFYSSSFIPMRQLLDNSWFYTTGSDGHCGYYATGTSSSDGCQNYPWQGNSAGKWSGNVFQMGSNPFTTCEPYYQYGPSTDLVSQCYAPFPSNSYQYVINPYNQYQVKGNLDNSYQDPGLIWGNQVQQGCGFPNTTPPTISGSTTTWYWPNDNVPSCPYSSPEWSSPHRQNLLDPNQYFTTTVSRTTPVGRSQTLAAWWIGWGIVNFDVDFFALLDNPVSFYAQDSCGNWGTRTTNFLELEVYLYMGSVDGVNRPLWGNFPVGSSPVVVALSGNPPRAGLFGCSTSAPYWIYVRTHPVQIDACYPNWCPQFTYSTMYSDIVSAENSARMTAQAYPWSLDGTMINFQAGIEAANYAMLWWTTDTEWWGSG